MLLLLACGAGIYLGLNFNIFALLPVSLLGLGTFIFVSLSSEYDSSWSLQVGLLPFISMQAGYMIGLVMRAPGVRTNVGMRARDYSGSGRHSLGSNDDRPQFGVAGGLGASTASALFVRPPATCFAASGDSAWPSWFSRRWLRIAGP